MHDLILAKINDLHEKLYSRARLFADDTAACRTIFSDHDQDQLQQDLHHLADWEKSWDMKFYPAKCQSLPITRSRNPLCHSCELHGHILDTVQSAKYLGITIHRQLNWDKHTNNTCNKANKTLGFLRRNLKISNSSIKDRSYKAFVRPRLEYASSVWDPHTQRNTNKAEIVQRRTARFVLSRYRNTSSVNIMLDVSDWYTLQRGRQISRLSGLVHCPSLKSKLAPLPSRQRRGHDRQFKLIPARTQYGSTSFLPRTTKDWRCLPKEVVEAITLDTFVSRASFL